MPINVISNAGKIAAGEILDIRPPAGESWLVQLITVNPTSAGAEILWMKDEAGVLTEYAKMAIGTSPYNVEFKLALTNSVFVRIRNLDTATEIPYGYAGVVL